MIRLLVIDDSRVDRVYLKALLTDGTEGSWLRNVELCMQTKPLDAMDDYSSFDGVLIDMHLGAGMDGVEIARSIHRHNWRIPILLMTGAHPDSIPFDAHDFIDYVAFKQVAQPQRTYDDIFGTVRAMMRQIGRIREGKLTQTITITTTT